MHIKPCTAPKKKEQETEAEMRRLQLIRGDYFRAVTARNPLTIQRRLDIISWGPAYIVLYNTV